MLSYSGGKEATRLSDMFQVAPQGFPLVLRQYSNALQSHEPAQDETWSNADGSDRWFQRQLIPFSGGLVVTYREVTETRRAHLAIEAAERNHRAILEGLADAVVVSDRDADGEYPITYANPAFFRLLGIPPDEVVEKGVGAFLPPEIAAAVVETRRTAIAAGGPIDRSSIAPASAHASFGASPTSARAAVSSAPWSRPKPTSAPSWTTLPTASLSVNGTARAATASGLCTPSRA
jgi:hypothetical protein